MLNNIAFTDPQNNSWTEAVFCVKSTTRNEYDNKEFVLDEVDMTNYQEVPNSSHTLTARYCFWTTQANYDARGPVLDSEGQPTGAPQAFPLLNANVNGEYFNISQTELEKAKYDGLTDVQKAELYLQDEILPTMQS